ncbi:hypothetical protein DFH11DRAFT_1539989 [Phellopilus nigrolimitatus]|nr:hypothetical protein DFH11DRAFT_1539989 [Phellopilus nigrolimitatus]
MSTAIHTPSHSPTTDFFAFRSPSRIANSSFTLSPCRQASATPPRKQPVLMLTPSPLRRRLDFDQDCDAAMQLDFDDFSSATGFSTPFHSPAIAASSPRGRYKAPAPPPYFHQPPSLPSDDEEGLFLRSNTGHTSLPNSVSNPIFSHAPKRKINHMSSSPKGKHGLTPLHVHQSAEDDGTQRLATLAPLPAPRFLRSQGLVGNNVGREVDTLKHMRIADRSIELESDSSSEEEFSSIRARRNTHQPVRPAGGVQEVVESVSPDGHITKRRTRSRPVSTELMASNTPAMSPKPPVNGRHRRNGSNTSVSETGSPLKKSRVEKTQPHHNRLASSATLFFGPAIVSSKPEPVDTRMGARRSPSLVIPLSTPAKSTSGNDDDLFSPISPDDSFTNAFSKPADTSLSFAYSVTAGSPSPRSRIPTKFKKPRDSGVALSDDEADDFLRPVLTQSTLRPGRPDSLHHLHARASTFPQPSTSYSTSSEATLIDDSLVTPSNESGKDLWPNSSLDVSVVDEFIVKTLEAGAKDGNGANKRMPTTPQKRTRTSFMGLPVQRPWASAVANKLARMPLFDEKLAGPNFGTVMDSGGSAGDLSVPRRGPKANKPRKSCPGDLKFPTVEQHLEGGNGLNRTKSSGSSTSELEISPTHTHLVKPPRHRTYGDVGLGRPVANIRGTQFLMRRSSSGAFSTASDVSDGSNLGTPTRKKDNEFRVPMLPLRSQYTPTNNSLQLTPLSPNLTPLFNEPAESRQPIRSQLPISTKRTKENRRPESSRFSTMGSPAEKRSLLNGRFNTKPPIVKPRSSQLPGDVREVFVNHHLEPPSRPDAQPGRFEREFVEVDKIGAGEFGSAIKVRFKHGHGREDRVFAVKKSKRFEGNRHRFRLREEVEILQHLSTSAGPGFHPNVLGYVDSWEEDDQLYILTELCEYGNFAHFLSEYGHNFARLEEARVWKILADISSGLRFMHLANVVHFDLKPANVFITASGRFKIGDFGMASAWPRLPTIEDGSHVDTSVGSRSSGFEREGDKMYLAAEVLQGKYGKETDIFSFGMMMLETATNIVVPAQGELWHKLREEDFSPVEGLDECSGALLQLITGMMRKDPAARPSADGVYTHTVVTRARERMEQALDVLRAQGDTRPEVLFKASPLAAVDADFLFDILGTDAGTDAMAMDWSE